MPSPTGQVSGTGRMPNSDLDLVHQLQGRATRAVALVDERDDRHAPAAADPVQLAGLGLDASRAVDDHDRGVGRPQRPVGVLGEVRVTRRVKQVEGPRPMREPQHGRRDGDAPLALQLHPVAGGRACLTARLDCAGLLDGAREQQELLGEGGLAGIRVADDGERAARRDLGRERSCRAARSPVGLGAPMRRPGAYPMATIRSMARRARAAVSSGTVTTWRMSRSESRSFSRVIIFM